MTKHHAAGRDARHRAIARILRDEIAEGNPAVGELLAGEYELCTRFDSSRHTVREALRTLSREGLIERRQGAGTRVVANQARGPYQPSMHSVEELRQNAAETVLRLDAVATAPLSKLEATLLGEAPESEWLRVDGVRWDGEEVVCSNRVFIQPDFAALLPDVVVGATLTASINEMISSRSGVQVDSVEQDILARAMPAATARHLDMRTGTTALLFVRRYRDRNGAIMLWSLNWHPSDRMVYRMRLQREGG
jgi:DNA-binding GntR family transcriptional regulator